MQHLMAWPSPAQILEGGPGVPWRQLVMYAQQSEMQRLQARPATHRISLAFRHQHVLQSCMLLLLLRPNMKPMLQLRIYLCKSARPRCTRICTDATKLMLLERGVGPESK